MKRMFLSLAIGSSVFFSAFSVVLATDQALSKMAVYVTPSTEDDVRFPIGYSDAIQTLRGHASTVWILESWQAIETAPGRFDWSHLDARVNAAIEAGFTVGLRIQIILCGHNARQQWVGVSRIPSFYDQDMRSQQFREKATAFYGALAQRYQGKARFVAVGNTVNKYFEENRSQWDGFKKAYNDIVDAIHQAAPKIQVVSDLSSGKNFWTHPSLLKNYLDFFAQSHDDLVGLVFYFIEKDYHGGDMRNFNSATLAKVLDRLHGMAPGKKLYLIETACFSKHPKTGRDMAAIQERYVRMLATAAKEKDYLAGYCWWQLYDAKDAPEVSWDLKASFGLFDSAGHPKKAWDEWIAVTP